LNQSNLKKSGIFAVLIILYSLHALAAAPGDIPPTDLDIDSVDILDDCSATEQLSSDYYGELTAISIDTIDSTPSSEQAGTIFTIKATVTDEAQIQSVAARLYQNDTQVDAFYLYDNGQSGDGVAGDGIYANTWDSATMHEGHYDIKITAQNEYAQNITITKNDVLEILPQGICKPMKSSGSQDDKLDIVFVPCDYNAGEEDKFRTDALAHMNQLLGFSPFDEYPDSINVYRVEKLGSLSCYYSGRCVLASGSAARLLASECGDYDKIIVIADSNEWAGCAYLGGIAHASSRYPWITVHEFGHSFGSLADEYSYGSYGSSSQPNCDSSSSCPKWAGVQGTGCFPQCQYDNLYRPTYDSTMRSSYNQDFGPVNKGVLRGLLDGYN